MTYDEMKLLVQDEEVLHEVIELSRKRVVALT